MKISGEVVYNYDRGLDVPPQNEAAEMAPAILMHEYNEKHEGGYRRAAA